MTNRAPAPSRTARSATPGTTTTASAISPRARCTDCDCCDHPAAARRGLQRAGAGDGPCAGCDGSDAVRRAHQRSRHRRQRHRLHGNGHRHRRAVREPGCGGEDAGRHVGGTGLDRRPDAGGRRPERHRRGLPQGRPDLLGRRRVAAGRFRQLPEGPAGFGLYRDAGAAELHDHAQLRRGDPARRGRGHDRNGEPCLRELCQAGRHGVHRGTRRRRAVRHLHLRG